MKTGTRFHSECIAVSIGWLCLGRCALLVTSKGSVAKLKTTACNIKKNQPDLSWALVTVRSGFVADVSSQILKQNANDTPVPKFFLRDLGFDVRIEMQKYTKAVEAITMIPQTWSGSDRRGLGTAFRASRHETNKLGHKT